MSLANCNLICSTTFDCSQIDIMWHTHMLSSIACYNSDCKALMGDTLHHDDSLTDRTEGGILDHSYQSTKQIWHEQFGEDYAVTGGMYRGEPPESYYGTDWTTIFNDSPLVMLTVPPEMGASSTSPTNAPTKWATLDSNTSDGSPAFVSPSKGVVTNRAMLKDEPYKENYILGRHSNNTGFYHIETREAHEIMLSRISSKCHRLESDIALQKCCCFKNRHQIIASKEVELEATKVVFSELTKRATADKPNSTGESNTIRGAYVDSNGAWLYPSILWASCGGACGGAIVCSTAVGGAAACGLGGDGGGGGGGGCGGGGCGGGGCGGG